MLLNRAVRQPLRRSVAITVCSKRPFRRYETNSTNDRPPTTWRQDAPNTSSTLFTNNFAQSTVYGLSIYARLAKYTIVTLIGAGILAWAAFEGAHMYVESVELAPESDQEVRKWEWDQEVEKWSGGDAGGTDLVLGFKGRHAVRSAWMAQNWGIGSGSSIIGSNASSRKGLSGAGGLNVVDARLEFAHDYLTIALAIAESRSSDDILHPQTIVCLLSRHAAILERMGSQASWSESRSLLERVWAGLPSQGMEAARTALKLGDLSSRLGDVEDALAWWARAINLTQQTRGEQDTVNLLPKVPDSAPSSPLAQRTLLSALVSLSAFYATSGQLKQAKAVEEESLTLLRTIIPPNSLKSSTAPCALHALYLLHRSSLISIHLAEVLFALQYPTTASLDWLSKAAESSERVALTLTGLPHIHPDAPLSQIPHPPASEAPLLPVFIKSNSMNKPATSLLRDARRTAAEAWNLMGILNEEMEGSMPKKALECYERALGWIGVSADRPGGIADPGEGILEVEWKVFWGNYVRARDAVRKRQDQS